MAKIIGIDVGTKNVGLAIADLESPIATPYGTFDRAQNRAEKEVLALLEDQDIELIIVGFPLDEVGKASKQCIDILDFTRRLIRRTNVQLLYVDEHLTSCEAEQKLIEAGKQRISEQKGVLDKAAATIILQSYLDSEGSSKVMTQVEVEKLVSLNACD